MRCARLEDVLGGREGVAIVAWEENEEPVIIRNDPSGEHRYCVLFDPHDGSSNLDVQPKAIHERTPVILGSADEVDHVAAQLG